MKLNNSYVGIFMKFEGCEGGNGIILYAGEISGFVLSVHFLCVPVFFLYIATLILVL